MKSYVEYFSQVLGLQTVMLPNPAEAIALDGEREGVVKPAFFYSAQGPQSEGKVFNKCSLAVVNWVREPQESLFQEEVAELFGKMLLAMKIPAEKVFVLDCVMNERELIPNELFKICQPACVLFFSREPLRLSEMQIKGPAKWLETLSPSLLLKEPNSKKIVWNDMQKIMKELE